LSISVRGVLSRKTTSFRKRYYALRVRVRVGVRGWSQRTIALRGRGSLFSPNIFRTREKGFFKLRTSALFGAKKLLIFQNLWCVRTDKRERDGRASTDILQTRGGGQFFVILCGCPMDSPLVEIRFRPNVFLRMC